MAARRYWRLYNREGGGSSLVNAAEIELRTSAGGADQTGSGTASASSSNTGTETPDRAFDNNTGTYWQGNGNAGVWIKYDFGAGNDKDIVQIAYTPLSGFGARAMRQFDIQSSPDDSTWTTEWSVSQPTWTSSQQVFTKPSAVNSQYWRVRADSLQSGTVMSCAEMELRATAGGADETGSGSGVGDSATNIANAFDNNTGTLWSGASINADCNWLGYNFGAGVTKDIQQVSWTSRNGTTADQNPTAGWVESGSDGISWISRWTFSGTGSWSLGDTKLFTNGAGGGSSSRRRMVMSW